jgi:hypothetical protein
LVQAEPPSSVTMIEASCPPSVPTATHVAELAVALGAHETALTLVKGVKLAVVSQLGATAPAGADGWFPRRPMMATVNTVEIAVTAIRRTVRNVASQSQRASPIGGLLVPIGPSRINRGGRIRLENCLGYVGCGAAITAFGGVRPARTSATPWQARRAMRVRVPMVALPM